MSKQKKLGQRSEMKEFQSERQGSKPAVSCSARGELFSFYVTSRFQTSVLSETQLVDEWFKLHTYRNSQGKVKVF